jgi:hypothetical protein
MRVGILLFVCLRMLAETATVHLNVVDPFGAPTDYTIRQFQSSENKDYSKAFQFGIGYSIPYGTYHYVIAPKAGNERTGTLLVVYPVHWFNIVVTRVGDSLPSLLKGKIIGLKRVGQLRYVAFLSAFGDYRFEAEIDKNGEFTIYNPVSGIFVLEVIEGAQIRRTQVVQLPAKDNSLIINLSE